MREQARLAIEDAEELPALGHRDAEQLLGCQTECVFLVHRRDIIEPVEVGQRLQVGLVLDQLLGPAVQKTDMRVDALDHLTVELQYETQDPVSRRMLGPEIEGEVAQGGFGHNGLASAAGSPPYTTTLGLSASITRAGIWREVLEFVRLPLPLLRVRRGRFFDRNIWPDSCVFRIQREPFLKPGFAISLDGIDGAFRFANATVDAFVRMDDEHVLALVEAVHGADFDAVHGFAANAAIVDDVGQLGVLPADCSGELIHGVRY